VIADHVIEIRDGGAKLEKQNIMLLCPPCHGKKTAAAKRARLGMK
jgi:5-methylcytosine-specific restriction protein A